MKKLLAILLAVLMVLPMCFSAMAASVSDASLSFTAYTGDSAATYNPNRQISVTISLRDINFGNSDGISAFEFDLYYDTSLVDPVYTAATDEDGDAGNFAKLISKNPGGWEAFGVLDTTNGHYGIAFGDNSGAGAVNIDDTLVIKIPFKTKADTRVTDLRFSFENVTAYNSDMSKHREIEVEDVVVKYAVQPAVNATVPSDAIPLDVAGYRNDINNVIFYAEKDTTIGNYVKYFCPTDSGQNKMSYYAILIAGTDGIITSVNTTTSSTSNKSSVKIPAGSYIIGVHSGNADDLATFKSLAKVGKMVTVYNINIEAAGRTDAATDLSRAAFLISDPSDGNDPFVGGIDPNTPKNEEDDNGNEGADPVPFILGDVNQNGEIDSRDYVFLKRAYFGTYKLTTEVSRLAADITQNGEIDSRDYVFLKRAYFGTYKIQQG